MKNALIVIDMQNDFIDGSLGSPEAVESVASVIAEIQKDYDGIFFTRDTHFDSYLDTLEGKNLPVKHCIIDTQGWQIRDDIYQAAVRTQKPLRVIDKMTFGSFALIDALRLYSRELESVTLVGLCTDICVVSNAILLRAAFPDLPIYVVRPACAGTCVENHEAALQLMKPCQIYEKEDA